MHYRTAVSDTDTIATLTSRGALSLTSAGLSLIAVCYGLARFAYGLFVPAFRREFGFDATTAGVIASGSYASYCVAIIVSTVLTPRFGGRVIAVAAGCIAAAGTLMIAAAPNAEMLAVGVLVAGSSTGVASPPLAHAVAHALARPAQNRTQTVINAGTGVGVAIAGPVALLTHEHWRAAWLTFAILCTLVTIWTARAVPTSGSLRTSRTSRTSCTLRSRRLQSNQGAAAAALPHPLLPAGSARLITASALMGAASAAVWTFGRDLLVTEGGMSARASMAAWILLGVLGVLGAAAGDIVGRFGIRTAWQVTALVLVAATSLLAALPGSLVAAWLAMASFGAAYIALTGILLVWGTRVYSGTPAAGVGLAFLVIAIGQAAGAPIIGAVTEASGAQTAFAAAALVGVVAAFIRPLRGRLSPTGPFVH